MSYQKKIDDGLVLRQFELDDARAFYDVVEANREAIGEFMLWVREVDCVESVRKMMGEWLDARAKLGELTLGIYLDDRLVGSVFNLSANRKHESVAIGYWLATEARGRGIAIRSVRAMFDITFTELGFHRASLLIAPHNEKSIAIAERLGLEREGVLRDLWQVEPGVWWDGVVYATTADRWEDQGVDA